MKITNLSKLVGGFGMLVITVSIIQWFFRFPDTSQLLLGCSIGTIFIGFGYLHSWMRNMGEEIEELNKGLDATRTWAVDEIEKIRKENEW